MPSYPWLRHTYVTRSGLERFGGLERADLLFDCFGFNRASKYVANCNVSKASESKLVKHEVGCNIIFPLYEVTQLLYDTTTYYLL